MDYWERFTAPEVVNRDTWQWDGEKFSHRSYGAIVAEAQHVAAGLQKRGIDAGDNVAMVITNGPDALSCVMGVWFAGATIASLPIIARGMSVPGYVMQLRRLCKLLGATCLVAEDRFLTFMTADADIGVDVVGCRSLIETAKVSDAAPPSTDDIVFIQFSSGTTGEPRGVELSGRAIDAHLDALSRCVAIDPERDIGYSWLPMSHDMGFFGCTLLGWYNGIPGILGTPERFLGAPRTWFDDCSDFGATVTAAPPFALDLAARAERTRSSGRPIKLRLCLVGAEDIRWDTLANAADVFTGRGLTFEALTPAYGLAEATLAVAVERLDRPPSFIDVDGKALVDGSVQIVDANDAEIRRLVCVGDPLPGVKVKISASTNEIVVSSPGLASGYFCSPTLTRERFGHGTVRTGDLGFLHDGRLFVSGRSDDLVVVAGRNVYVQDLETRIATDKDVRTGNCAIVDIRDGVGSRVTLVAELNAEQVDTDALAIRLYRRTMEEGGLMVRDFVFLERGAFPKTPSGKVQRYRCREMVANSSIGKRITLGSAS